MVAFGAVCAATLCSPYIADLGNLWIGVAALLVVVTSVISLVVARSMFPSRQFVAWLAVALGLGTGMAADPDRWPAAVSLVPFSLVALAPFAIRIMASGPANGR